MDLLFIDAFNGGIEWTGSSTEPEVEPAGGIEWTGSSLDPAVRTAVALEWTGTGEIF